MATIQDIAEKLGVSKSTISKAINNASDISETLRKTILETAVEMGYQKLRRPKNQTNKLVIFIENMDYTSPSHFGYDIVMGFRQIAEPAGFSVDLIPLSIDLQSSTPYDVFMLEHNYLGAFIVGIPLNEPWIHDFKSSRTPTALYDNYIKANPTTAYVGIDNIEGMDLAVSHLKKLGHHKIGYLSGALGALYTQSRYKAFFTALQQNHLYSDPALGGNAYHISECIAKHLPRLLSMQVTGILCSHDLLANAAMIQCQELGYRVPDDISIIGFDDLPLAAYTQPPLTTIRQNRIEIGKCAYYALNSLMNQVPIGTMLLHAQLIERASTAPPQI